MELQSPRGTQRNADRLGTDAGHFLRVASNIMNEDVDEENDSLEALDTLECSKCPKCHHCKSNTKSLTNTIRSTMLEINEIKERHRERRHREFMALLEKYLGSVKHKSPEVLRNIKTEDIPIHNTNEQSELNEDESSEMSGKTKESSTVFQALLQNRKRLSESNNITVPPKKPIKPQNNTKTAALKQNIDTRADKTLNQRDELAAMRQQMLEVQRRKMEDRERKKRENMIA